MRWYPILTSGWLGLLACASAGVALEPDSSLPLTTETHELAPELEAEPALGMRPPRLLDEDGNFYVLDADASHPRVRYRDGQVSLNSTCAIRVENKLSRRIPPAYVNGRPLGFC